GRLCSEFELPVGPSLTTPPISPFVSRLPRKPTYDDDDDPSEGQADQQGEHRDRELGRRPVEQQQHPGREQDDEQRQAEGRRAEAGVDVQRASLSSSSAPRAAATIPLAASRSTTWQATSRPALSHTRPGLTTSHKPGSNSGQRGWNVQPDGRRSRLGISRL